MLNDFTAWQYEIAIIASRFRLELLSEGEIIGFTHKLMDKGYYDDMMLDIIELNPLIYNFNSFTDFKTLWNILALPNLDSEASQYLNIFNLAYHLILQPFNFPELLRLSKERTLYCTFETAYFHKNLPLPYLVTEDLEIIFSLLNDLENYFIHYLQNQIKLAEPICKYMELSNFCETWLEQNEKFILEIMHQLFPNP